MKIVPRDYILMQQISKWRFLLGRQIKILADFPSQRTVDRRIKILKEAGYIKGAYKLYGVPALYFATNKAKNVFNLDFVTTDVKIARIVHDIAVVDTAIYFMKKLKVVILNLNENLDMIVGLNVMVIILILYVILEVQLMLLKLK